jgi:LysM repeat protein
LVLILILSLVAFGAPFAFAADTTTAATTWTGETTPGWTAPVKATTTVAAVPAGASVYVVKSGDAMWKIAAMYKMTLAQIGALNPQIKNLGMIYVGQKIVVKAGTTALAAAKTYLGLGYKVNWRNGPGSWPEEGAEILPVYSFNVAMASATFDANGKILNVFMDGYEVATPNYDGAGMPHFSGWPGIESYKVTDHTTLAVSAGPTITADTAAAEVNGWLTKRERGDAYHMNPANEWYKQMDFYQNFFKGKTVAEVKAWFAKYGTAAYGPIKATTTNAADLAKFNALTVAEKAQLADVVSGATMRVNDSHGMFIDALQIAYDNRVEVK